MGKCRFCQEKAGFLKDHHDSCWEAAETARKRLAELVSEGILNGSKYEEIEAQIKETRALAHLPSTDARILLLDKANSACLKLATDSPLDFPTYERLFAILQGIGYTPGDPETKTRQWFGFVAIEMSQLIFEVLHGFLPQYNETDRMQFQLGRNEQPVFSTGRVVLAEQRTVTTRGAYQSIGLPIGGGMYYRIGSSGSPTRQTGLTPTDEGEMLFTNKALYFGGQRATVKIPYSSILRLESFIDGIGVHQSHGSGKVFLPDYSGMDTGWFFYNFLNALMKLES